MFYTDFNDLPFQIAVVLLILLALALDGFDFYFSEFRLGYLFELREDGLRIQLGRLLIFVPEDHGIEFVRQNQGETNCQDLSLLLVSRFHSIHLDEGIERVSELVSAIEARWATKAPR